MTLLPLDFIFIAIILLITVMVTLKGFIAEFFSKAAVLIGAAGALLFYGKLTPFIARFVGGKTFPSIIAFLSLFLILYLFVKVIQRFAGLAFESETMTNLDRALGFFLGVAEGIIVVILILIAIRLQPWFEISSFTDKSFFARLLEPIVNMSPGVFSVIMKHN